MLMDDSELAYGELAYERRIVSFFDILGWREHIAEAGDDARHIARLASMPRMFSRTVMGAADRAPGAQLTSFSDNVVSSVPFEPKYVEWILQSLATIQLGAALAGFWVRGSVTIGNLHHDADIVFGPALNRAYVLESQQAQYSRIIVDPQVPELLACRRDFIDTDGDFHFVDPFRPAFIDRIQRASQPNQGRLQRFNDLANGRVPPNPATSNSLLLLGSILTRLTAEMSTTKDERARKKQAWLRARLAEKVGELIGQSEVGL
ncbi:hypothetical protein ABIC08_006884 [Bradyrhizobium sp. RT9b]|uniref:hypothetical protein n=1 Tax=unclassified Bradyrhizobium TaxID=2631580 RepID=UPI0033941951